MTKPLAVVISDIHFTVPTLELASSALRQARAHAVSLGVPLYIAGDTLDSKAIMRGECVNRLLQIFAEFPSPRYTKILVGNHDLFHEKSEEHTLEFLSLLPSIEVIRTPRKDTETGVLLIPYQKEGSRVWKDWLPSYQAGHLLLLHQGVQGANTGHYIQDASAIDASLLKNYRSCGGHYHDHHTVGTHTFIGNPYSLSFGEVKDHVKGFCVLSSDGTLQHIPTHLRKHVKVERSWERAYAPILDLTVHDLLWLTLTGPRLELDRIQKSQIGKGLPCGDHFKLDLIPTDEARVKQLPSSQTHVEMMDSLIDESTENAENKQALKELYKSLLQ